ncbi:MAG: WD40 repeat domain-containing protein [Hyphomicrobium sp.]|uniref:WD40 repeat domain-containing protein n=1 Tax=Hyphomicrobium sp. TaxID=82 RepID=UPI003D11D274
MIKRAGLALLLHAFLAAGALAQTEEELRVWCKDEKARAEMRKELADYQIEEFDWEIKLSCPRLDLPRTPVHDSTGTMLDKSHTDWIYDAVYSADGRTILSAGKDYSLGLWDAESGKMIRRIAMPPGPAPSAQSSVAYVRSAVFVGDGSKLAATKDGTPVLLFDTATGKQLAELPFKVAPDDFPPNMAATKGGLLLLAGVQDEVMAFDTGAMMVRTLLAGHLGEATAVAVSEAADLVATAAKVVDKRDAPPWERDVHVHLWRLGTGEKVGTISLKSSDMQGLTFSRDGAQLAVLVGGSAHVYATKDRSLVRTLLVHPRFSLYDAAFTADGRGLITCQSHAMLWDIASGEIVRHFGPFQDLCHSVDVSPDGAYVVTTSMTSDLKVFEIATGTFYRRLGVDVNPPR